MRCLLVEITGMGAAFMGTRGRKVSSFLQVGAIVDWLQTKFSRLNRMRSLAQNQFLIPLSTHSGSIFQIPPEPPIHKPGSVRVVEPSDPK